MKGIVSKIQPYTKDGVEKAIVTIWGENGVAEDLFLTKKDVLAKELVPLTDEELKNVFSEFETVDFTPSNRIATLD